MADKKLDALLRHFEVEEHQVLREQLRVDGIVEQRKQLVDDLQKERQRVVNELGKFSGKVKLDALRSGQTLSAAACEQFGKKLRQEIKRLDAKIKRCESELKQAQQRAAESQDELVEARIERKKVEILQTNRQNKKRIEKASLDEQALEEINTRNRKS